jgi:hypothetical protein
MDRHRKDVPASDVSPLVLGFAPVSLSPNPSPAASPLVTTASPTGLARQLEAVGTVPFVFTTHPATFEGEIDILAESQQILSPESPTIHVHPIESGLDGSDSGAIATRHIIDSPHFSPVVGPVLASSLKVRMLPTAASATRAALALAQVIVNARGQQCFISRTFVDSGQSRKYPCVDCFFPSHSPLLPVEDSCPSRRKSALHAPVQAGGSDNK